MQYEISEGGMYMETITAPNIDAALAIARRGVRQAEYIAACGRDDLIQVEVVVRCVRSDEYETTWVLIDPSAN